jgi:hypothetical protein
MEHELVHVIQYLIVGQGPLNTRAEAWFLEGLAEAMVGGTSGGAIRGLDQLNRLTERYGWVSPVSFKSYTQITPEAGYRFDYPMFQLAVEYLMADEGLGRSAPDARVVFLDIAHGATFQTAFEAHMGIGPRAYEHEFFNRMGTYLPQYRNPWFSPAGVAVASALVILFVFATLALGYVRWRPAHGSLDGPAPGRAARIAFYAELTAASATVVLLFLRGMVAFGADGILNNVMERPVRTRGYGALSLYLLVSLALLLWAVRGWNHRSRSAVLVPPLVLTATAVTYLVINAMI